MFPGKEWDPPVDGQAQQVGGHFLQLVDHL